jgi:hypothetical protein
MLSAHQWKHRCPWNPHIVLSVWNQNWTVPSF